MAACFSPCVCQRPLACTVVFGTKTLVKVTAACLHYAFLAAGCFWHQNYAEGNGRLLFTVCLLTAACLHGDFGTKIMVKATAAYL